MPRYRLDQRLHLSQGISRRRAIWLEEIKFDEDGEIYYTENYVQISLIKLLKYLKRYPLIKPMEEIKNLCAQYLELQAQREDITKRMALVETSLENIRLGLNPDDIYQIPITFYLRLNGSLYRLDFDEEDTRFIRLKQVSNVQIID